jgi:uncharacterized iron-regulated membrane protein
VNSKLRVLHKYVSLTVAAIWTFQALTGALLVFHWEFDDALLGGASVPLNIERLGGSIDAMILSRQFGTPTGVYWSGGDAARFDVIVRRGEKSDVVRVDGEGKVLRFRPWDHDFAHIGLFQIITYLHQTLFAHDPGKWFLGASGFLLLSNLIVGLKLAWPRRNTWRAALLPRRSTVLAATVFSWHRALGLSLAAFAILSIGAGVLMAYEDPLADWFDDARPNPPAAQAAAEPARGRPVTTAEAIKAALERYPSAALTGIDLPDADSPWIRVELRQKSEWRRVSGRTSVFVSSRSGRLLREYDARLAPLKTRFWDGLYAIHTGEAGGWPGRVAAVLIGIWLLTMIALGLTLWWVRRKRPASKLKGH